MCVSYFSACCLCDTYLTMFCIQKPIKMSLGNFASFSGRIASCFCQLLNCFTKGSQKSLVVAIYSQVKKFSIFIQSLIVYYWHFKVKVISFLLLHTAQKIYKTLSCLLPSRNFPARSQLYKVRKTVFRTFFLRCCLWAGKWLMGCLMSRLAGLLLCFGRCFVGIRILSLKFSAIVSENKLWKVVLKLLCCHWISTLGSLINVPPRIFFNFPTPLSLARSY